MAVLSWNGRHHLEICLAALREQEDPGIEWDVLVLDNGSSDGTAGWVRENHPWVRLIESPVNLGFCAGNNRLVAECDGDAVALLNNDTRPKPGWLAALAGSLAGAPADVAAVSGLIVDWEGERLDFARGALTFDGHAFQLDFRRPLSRVTLPAAGTELPFACGGNLIVRRASFLAAGGFDEDYFAYLEDVDLGWRLWAGGERILFAPEAVVHHRSSATSDLLGLFNRGFLFERNAFLTAYKNYEPGLWEQVMPALLLTFLSRTQTMLIENNPGGESLRIDPFAGWIANTASPTGTPLASAAPAAPPLSLGSLARKWRDYGPREFAQRALRKLFRRSSPPLLAGPPQLTDERTIAQFRTLSFLLGQLDVAAARRAQVQQRRKRPDREIFERFPLYLVPTYPGDAALFASPGFQSWLPADLPLVRSTLAEVMEFG